jgi:hypothetical protein
LNRSGPDCPEPNSIRRFEKPVWQTAAFSDPAISPN